MYTNKMMLVLAAVICSVSAQFVYHHSLQQNHIVQPLSYQNQVQFQPQFAQESQIQQVELRPLVPSHRAVEYNAQQESLLPAQLKNQFYSDPRIAASLAKESWLTNKEMPVVEREAEKIPREQIFKMIKNAAFVHRRR